MRNLIRKILKEQVRQKWTEDLLKDVASKFKTKGEFLKLNPNAYEAAKRRGKDFFDSITSHMVPTERQVPSGYWTYENVKTEAENYNTRTDFQKGSKGAYLKAREMDWLDDVTTHMTDSKNKKLNTQSFINKAKEIHGDDYDYSAVDYKKSNKKVEIFCPKHNLTFYQNPEAHLQGHGCPKCRYDKSSSKNKSNTQEFVQKAIEIHGNKYVYDKVNYLNAKEKVIVVCTKDGHGEFMVQPNHHLSSKTGCPKCRESQGELLISNFLTQNNIDFETQKKYKDCKGIGNIKCRVLPFDFYLPKYNILIEYDGRQHFQPVYGEEQLLIQKKIDGIKNDYTNKNNIHLIRIPYTMNKEDVFQYIKTVLGIV